MANIGQATVARQIEKDRLDDLVAIDIAEFLQDVGTEFLNMPFVQVAQLSGRPRFVSNVQYGVAGNLVFEPDITHERPIPENQFLSHAHSLKEREAPLRRGRPYFYRLPGFSPKASGQIWFVSRLAE
jgi:hypothetical protein